MIEPVMPAPKRPGRRRTTNLRRRQVAGAAVTAFED